MRFARKLALALWLGICVIYILNAIHRMNAEIQSFEADMRRDHAVMGRGLAPATVLLWEGEGVERALAVVEQTNRNESQMMIRWVDLGASATPADKPAAPSDVLEPVARGEAVSWADRTGVGALHTYVPLKVRGEWRGALEFTESFQAERNYVRSSVKRVLLTTAGMALVAGALTLYLGIRFVGRPMRLLVEKARRVGTGDFSRPLELHQDDEFGELAREMDLMAERLADARTRADTEAAARIAALEQLRHGERLATVGQLSSGLAHELGTPLNVITQRAKMVANGEVEGAEARVNARIVAEQSERITHIVRQLLDFARRRSPEAATLDLPQAIERVCLLLSPFARKQGVTLIVEPTPARARANADPVQLQQVLTNLVLNAIQAMPDGGTVTVSFFHAHRAPHLGGAPRAWVGVSVVDHGRGIAPEHLSRVFDPFFTTKEVGEGTGLGLSVAWGIVAEHGGWIDVENRPDAGARFRVFLQDSEA
jgi:two-component system NtrC family sensor kinase